MNGKSRKHNWTGYSGGPDSKKSEAGTGKTQELLQVEDLVKKIKEEAKKGITSKGTLNVELVRLAEQLGVALGKQSIPQSAVRRVYDSFVKLNIVMRHEFIANFQAGQDENASVQEAAERAFQAVEPRVILAKSKSRYVFKRKQGDKKSGGYYRVLQDFVDGMVDNIHSKSDFEGFIELFECLVANLKEDKTS